MAERITTNYGANTKELLFAEIEARRAEGSPNFEEIDLSDTKDALLTALKADDDMKAQVAAGEPVAAKRENNPVAPGANEYKDSYLSNVDGEIYGLCVVPEDHLGRTHKLRNDAHFWEGSIREFKATFEKQ